MRLNDVVPVQFSVVPVRLQVKLQVSWTTAPYPYLGATLTLLSVSATVSSDVRSLTGSFTWSLTGTTLNCTGTTSFNLTRQSST